ncbi:unnamed protein product [Rangifer tarandus platyrhynchus]|uniref:Uncharacterized protein n=2 Tax=Rangifer tarandus platyrhynchus TaxID=3082113 RepID=A0ABN8Y543_RANTA|nr:unnamed protein product [Rangifer tarandus platyrhynchus]
MKVERLVGTCSAIARIPGLWIAPTLPENLRFPSSQWPWAYYSLLRHPPNYVNNTFSIEMWSQGPVPPSQPSDHLVSCPAYGRGANIYSLIDFSFLTYMLVDLTLVGET